MARYASLVRKIAATGAHILVPCQKGALDLPTFWKRALEILGIPDTWDQTALLPVAHTTGGDFVPSPRAPVEGSIIWNRRVT